MDEDEDGLGSYSAVARAINAAYGLAGTEAAYDRRNIEMWYRRRTRNAAGDPPPEPVQDLGPDTPRTRPRILFRLADWVAWARPGLPAPSPNQHALRYETMPERRARLWASRP